MSGLDGLAWTEVLLINGALASILAVLVAGIERWRPKALWLHGLWLLVILRFVAPPMVPLEVLPVGWLGGGGPVQEQDASALEAAALKAATSEVAGSEAVASAAHAATHPLVSPSMPGGSDSQGSVASVPPAPVPPAPFWDASMEQAPMVLGMVWAWVALLILALTGRQVTRLMGMAKNGTSPHLELHQLAQDLADRVGLRRMPRMCVVDDPRLASPMVLSTLAGPQLLLPKALLDALNEDELSTVLVHEWAHVRRRDHWVRWPEWLALVVFWWNPLVWWARRALRRAEERCVDGWVLRLLPQRRTDYARALVETAALGAGSPRHAPVLSSGIETMNSMEGRLTMILQDTSRRNAEPSPWIRWAMWPALVLALTLLPVWGPSLTAGGDEDSKEIADIERGERVSSNVLRAERLVQERERLDERVRELEVRHGELRNETEERMGELQERSRELAEREGAAESARQGLMLQEQMERLEHHWAMQSRSYEMRSAALQAERLHLDAEAADLEGDTARARMLREEHLQRAEVLRQRERQHAEQAEAFQQQHLEQEKARLQQHLERLQDAGELQDARRLEGELKRLQLEREHLAREQALRKEQMALQTAQEAAEKAMHEAQQDAEQRIESMQGQEKAAVQAAMEAEQRALEAKVRAIEKQRQQAEAKHHVKALQAELPLRVEELRLAMEEVEDEKARQELRAELERVHRELGEILDGE